MVLMNRLGVELVQALHQSPLAIRDDTEFYRLTEKSTHEVYVFQLNLEHYVVKCFEKEAFSQLNRACIFNLQKALFNKGMAPKPIWFDEKLGVWVELFYDASQRDVKGDDNYRRLGETLAHLHSFDVATLSAPFLNLPEQWQRYLDYIPRQVRNAWHDDVVQASQDYYDFFDVEPRVLCHHDLSFEHILNYKQPVVVDWEYAGLGNRYFDIVAALLINNTPRHKENLVCEGYSRISRLAFKEIQNGIQTMKLCAKVTNGLWYAAKSTLPL